MSGETRDRATLIIRVGGISFDVLEDFSTRLGDQVDRLRFLTSERSRQQERVCDRLYEAIRLASSDTREALLAAKRLCRSGRGFSGLHTEAAWNEIESAAPTEIAGLATTEERVADTQQHLRDAYEKQREMECRIIVESVQNPNIRCGVAMGSPTVARELYRLDRQQTSCYGRREKRLLLTLLRYLSRASLKLSPLSTLTPVGICDVKDDRSPLRLHQGERRLESFVRLRRHVLDRCLAALAQVIEWRRSLVVVANDSILHGPDGAQLLWRPYGYVMNESEGTVKYRPESLVHLRVASEIATVACRLVTEANLTYGVLVEALQLELPAYSVESIMTELDRLVDLGHLQLSLAWHDTQIDQEQEIIRKLALLPCTHPAQAIAHLLGSFLHLGKDILSRPDAACGQLEQVVDDLLSTAVTITGNTPQAAKLRPSGHDVYHDIMCYPATGSDHHIATIGRVGLSRAIRNIEPCVRYSMLFDRRPDFLWSLAEQLRRSFSPSCHTYPLLATVDASRQLWNEFVRFCAHRDKKTDRSAVFNPFSLSVIDELNNSRAAVSSHLANCLEDTTHGRYVDVDRLDTLLDLIPKHLVADYIAPCMFLQPATKDCELWVQNGIYEGTGRCGSRHTALIPHNVQANIRARLIRNGELTINGEQVQLLSIYCSHGDTLNVHEEQTPKTLVLPGTNIEVSNERRMSLSDLYVTTDTGKPPELRGRDGQRYLPVHLGLSAQRYLPSSVRYLCTFGPSELSFLFPPLLTRVADGVTISERLIAGNVVLRRKSWRVPASAWSPILKHADEVDVFIEIHNFLHTHGIPSRVFILEPIRHPVRGEYLKPQYIDFSSPSFVAMWKAIVNNIANDLVFVEMLPQPDAFPEDATGRRWAVELIVDSLALGHAPASTITAEPERDGQAASMCEFRPVTTDA